MKEKQIENRAMTMTMTMIINDGDDLLMIEMVSICFILSDTATFRFQSILNDTVATAASIYWNLLCNASSKWIQE